MSSFEPFLISSLKKYKYRDDTKSDVLLAISTFPGLKPQYEDYVFTDGSNMMLLQLCGTIPTTYNGIVDNIPIRVCLMDTHPCNAPIVFVTPTATMQINSGRYVDQNGKVDLPYLRQWNYPNSELLGMLQILSIVFAEEPPLYARQQAINQPPPPEYPRPHPTNQPPPPLYARPQPTKLTPPPRNPTKRTANPPAGGRRQAPPAPRSISDIEDQTTDSSTIDEEVDEIQKLQGLLRCKICKVRRVALAYLPCGHCVACEECGSKVHSCPKCPDNGVNTRGTIKILFAP
ncbi:tumor susceptibility gene 101 protein-like isoform X3 [Dreissena polymorpha]|uniref:tumor susceptibility gene 101 protein-like isoform X2 n=1 Tax=Dreissena polymorpha TaxID=45954 RepID=UPI002264F1BC|nr:tumor susceptibility gene 101 protein-like isoform X2 [Dreissena polymorpha]XP_052238880.1 tumor susceptibility gene 101 protein-like isoform X3 [Dreissena polymorpha]